MLEGPFDLTFDTLQNHVPHDCGIYALGYIDSVDRFRVERVGRDDRDLLNRLRQLIGSSLKFKYATTSGPRLAFEAECALFHRFRPIGNFTHPDRPHGSGWVCPVCQN
jgi:hypothetical protein